MTNRSSAIKTCYRLTAARRRLPRPRWSPRSFADFIVCACDQDADQDPPSRPPRAYTWTGSAMLPNACNRHLITVAQTSPTALTNCVAASCQRPPQSAASDTRRGPGRRGCDPVQSTKNSCIARPLASTLSHQTRAGISATRSRQTHVSPSQTVGKGAVPGLTVATISSRARRT